MEGIRENLRTPIRGEYDILVAGGGVAGVAAAVAARRAGVKRVLLLEKSISFGGLATRGLISLYEPLCDGFGHKITYGMAAELMQLCMKYGPDQLPEQWRGDPDKIPADGSKYKTFFSPAMFTMALDEFVLGAGVEVLFDTQVVLPLMEGKTCKGLVVENKTGRGCYLAKTVIDTTGDADIFYRAGAPCVTGDNYMTYLAYRIDGESIQAALAKNNMLLARKWNILGSGPKGVGHPEGMERVSGTTAEEVTRYVLGGRKMMLDSMRDEDRFSRDLMVLPSMAQFRTTRRIAGAYAVTEADLCRKLPDSVGPVCDFLTAGEWYEIPYRALYAPGYPNLFTAGRTAAAEGWAWVVVRVIPGAVCSGEAVGIAAALCQKLGLAAEELPYETLRQAIEAAGGKPHPVLD